MLNLNCPDCGFSVGRTERVKLEFFGGAVVCTGCGAVLHLDHRWWWLLFAAIGCEGTLLVLLGIVLAAAAIGWWLVVPLIAAYVAMGIVVALTSPLKVVDRPGANDDLD